MGLLYGYRAVTMIVTVLPSANSEYHCDQQLNHTISSAEVLHRVVKIMSGFGLSINGHHVYCGDFIFSGHTMILVLCSLIIADYAPRRLWPLSWLVWVVAVVGVGMLLAARGHYTIDVVAAYFVTTRLWYVHQSIINNRGLQQTSSTNYLSRYTNTKHNLSLSISFMLPLSRCQVVVVETGGVVRGERASTCSLQI